MKSHEVTDEIEHAHHAGEKAIGVTMAIVAVLLAVVTGLGYDTHTEELLQQNKATDQWSYYQAKNNRSRMHADNARLAALIGGEKAAKLADEMNAEAEKQRKGADDVQKEARQLDDETAHARRRALILDVAEMLMETSIVLCSISLLIATRLFWKISFVTTAVGVGFALFAYLPH
jgi:hypothetical protein